MLAKIKNNYFILISTILFLYFFFNLLDGERGLISYFEKKKILNELKNERINVVNKINELEWYDNKIYANTYQFNKEVGLIINPNTGSVEGVIDFSGLKDKVKQHDKLDVQNGIVYNKKRQTFFVTGKYWNKLFFFWITTW